MTQRHWTGYAEGTAELMMPVNNGYYVKAPLEGVQVYRINSDGGFTEVPYKIGNPSYDVEGKYVGRCQLCKRTGPAGMQCVNCPQTLQTSAHPDNFLYQTGLMHKIPPNYTKGVQEGLEVFVGAKCLSPKDPGNRAI